MGGYCPSHLHFSIFTLSADFANDIFNLLILKLLTLIIIFILFWLVIYLLMNLILKLINKRDK